METASKSSLAFAILLTLQLADMYKPKSCSIIYLNSRNRKPSFPVRKKIWSNTFSSGMDDSWKYILFKGHKTALWNRFVSLIFCRLKRTERFFCCFFLSRTLTSSPRTTAAGRRHSGRAPFEMATASFPSARHFYGMRGTRKASSLTPSYPLT